MRDRTAKDVAFAGIYVLFYLASLGCGFYARSHTVNIVESQAACENTPPVRVLSASDDFGAQAQPVQFDDFLAFITRTKFLLVGVIGLSIVAGFIWCFLLKTFTKPIVYFTAVLIPSLLIISGVFTLANASQAGSEGAAQVKSVAYMLLGAGALAFLVMFCYRKRLNLTAAILKESCHALQANTTILCYALLVIFVHIVSSAAMIYFLVMAIMNGSFKRDPQTNDCVYVLAEYSSKLITVFAVNIIWTAFLFSQIRLCMVAGAVGMWYFDSDRDTPVSSRPLTSLKWAVTTSFGSLAFGSLILTIVQLIKSMLKEKGKDNAAAAVLACLVSCLMSWLEFINKFTTVMIAIRGESFCDSAKSTFDLLKRNLLSTLVVDSMSGMVLGLGSLVFGVLVAFAGRIAAKGIASDYGTNGDIYLWVFFAFAFYFSFAIMSFFGGVILNIVDAVFIFYAIDKDTQTQPNQYSQGMHTAFEGLHQKVQPTNEPANV